MNHEIAQRHAPMAVIVTCSCGWSHTETRRQNAFARAGKVRRAIRGHLDLVDANMVREAARELLAADRS